MLGFIKKDLAIVKSNLKFLGILIVVYTIMGLYNSLDISFLLPFICTMIMLSTFSYDSYNKWDGYALTLPNGQVNNVRAKYVASILLLIIVAVITTLLAILIAYYHKSINYIMILSTISGSIIGMILVISVMYPIIYKFGIEKARIGIFLIVFGIVIIGGIILKYIDLTNFINALEHLGNYLIPIIISIIILLFYISYRISLKIYLKKEF